MEYLSISKQLKKTNYQIAARKQQIRFLKELQFAIDIAIYIKEGKVNLLNTTNFVVKRVIDGNYVIKHSYKFLSTRLTNSEGVSFYDSKTDVVISNLELDYLLSFKEFMVNVLKVSTNSLVILQEEADYYNKEFDSYYESAIKELKLSEIQDAIEEGKVSAIVSSPESVKDKVTTK